MGFVHPAASLQSTLHRTSKKRRADRRWLWKYLELGTSSGLRKDCKVQKRQREIFSEEREDDGKMVFLENESERDRQGGRVEKDHRSDRISSRDCTSSLGNTSLKKECFLSGIAQITSPPPLISGNLYIFFGRQK